jgi:hypothetical protein
MKDVAVNSDQTVTLFREPDQTVTKDLPSYNNFSGKLRAVSIRRRNPLRQNQFNFRNFSGTGAWKQKPGAITLKAPPPAP